MYSHSLGHSFPLIMLGTVTTLALMLRKEDLRGISIIDSNIVSPSGEERIFEVNASVIVP